MIWLAVYLVGVILVFFTCRWAHLNGFSNVAFPKWKFFEMAVGFTISLMSWFFFLILAVLYFLSFRASKYEYRDGGD